MQQKGVSPYCLKKALKEINEDDYRQVLEKLALVKWKELSIESGINRKARVFSYLMRKGYETNLIGEVINNLMKQK